VLEWLKAHPVFRSLVTLVLSSSKQERDVSRAYMLGANSYLAKPNDTVGFVELTRAIIHYWFNWSQRPHISRSSGLSHAIRSSVESVDPGIAD
jgi:DNA-binding NarL/FixJ family response regulator